MSFVIGIDIGKFGGIFCQGEGKHIMRPMPLTKDEKIDFVVLYKLLLYFKNKKATVCFENTENILGGMRGTKSTWSLSYQTGFVDAICLSLGIKVIKVRPQTWQKEMFAGIDVKKGDDSKTKAYWSFLHHFPKLVVPKGSRGKILDGQIDAALLCRYAQRITKQI